MKDGRAEKRLTSRWEREKKAGKQVFGNVKEGIKTKRNMRCFPQVLQGPPLVTINILNYARTASSDMNKTVLLL